MKKLILGLLLSSVLCITACGNDNAQDHTNDKGIVGDTGEAIKDGAEDLGEDIREGVDDVGDSVERNMDNATGSDTDSENSNVTGDGKIAR